MIFNILNGKKTLLPRYLFHLFHAALCLLHVPRWVSWAEVTAQGTAGPGSTPHLGSATPAEQHGTAWAALGLTPAWSSTPWQQTMAHPSRGMLPSRQRTFPQPSGAVVPVFLSVNDHNGHTAMEGSSAQFCHALCSPKPVPCPKFMPDGWGMLSRHMGWTAMAPKVQTGTLFVSAIYPKPPALGTVTYKLPFHKGEWPSWAGDLTLEQAAQRGCRVSLTGILQSCLWTQSCALEWLFEQEHLVTHCGPLQPSPSCHELFYGVASTFLSLPKTEACYWFSFSPVSACASQQTHRHKDVVLPKQLTTSGCCVTKKHEKRWTVAVFLNVGS